MIITVLSLQSRSAEAISRRDRHGHWPRDDENMTTIYAKHAKTFLDQALGLINPKNSRTMFFQTRFGIHTFFLRKPIDILVLDSSYHVSLIKSSLSPYRLYFYPPKYNYVLELPEGYIKEKGIKLDDKINLCLT
jgi:uncharacterized membrane protein (UPF0127 family)